MLLPKMASKFFSFISRDGSGCVLV